jgi:hypothetical protein
MLPAASVRSQARHAPRQARTRCVAHSSLLLRTLHLLRVSARARALSYRPRCFGLSTRRALWPPRYDHRPSPHVRPCFLSSKASSNLLPSRQICLRHALQPTCAPWPQDPAPPVPHNVRSRLRRLLAPVARWALLHLRPHTSPLPVPAPARPLIAILRRSSLSTPSLHSRTRTTCGTHPFSASPVYFLSSWRPTVCDHMRTIHGESHGWPA